MATIAATVSSNLVEMDILTTIANTLDKLLKGLFDINLLGSYSVEMLLKKVDEETKATLKYLLVEHICKLNEILLLLPDPEYSNTDNNQVLLQNVSNISTYITSNNLENIPDCLERESFLHANNDLLSLTNVQTEISTDDKLLKISKTEPDGAVPYSELKIGCTPGNYFDDDFAICDNLSLEPFKCDLNDEDNKEINGTYDKKSNRGNKYPCDMCDKILTSVTALKDHFSKEHEGIGCFPCPECGRRFTALLTHRRHLNTHTADKPAKCNVCGKKFSRPDYLHRHKRIHSGSKPYACSQCPLTFISKSALLPHERTHSGLKNYSCEICSKTFMRSDKLNEHKKRHLRVKENKCKLCDRNYFDRRDLRRHMRTIHDVVVHTKNGDSDPGPYV